MPIMRRLIEIMGGTVTAASVLGKGSAFSLRFSEVAISTRLPTAEKLDGAGPVDFNELRPSTFLVVDDNEPNCQLVAGMFDGSHHWLQWLRGRRAGTAWRSVRPRLLPPGFKTSANRGLALC